MTAGQVWAKREYIMKINGVTVFQETLTTNSSRPHLHTHTHTPPHACVIRRLHECLRTDPRRNELKSLVLRRLSSATTHGAQWTNGAATQKGAKQSDAKKTIRMLGVRRRPGDFIPFIAAYSHFCISSVQSTPAQAPPLNSYRALVCVGVVHSEQWIKQLISSSFCQSEWQMNAWWTDALKSNLSLQRKFIERLRAN